jgi:UDP-N-acetylglucosamine 2-epimerase (non-hydrolysing)
MDEVPDVVVVYGDGNSALACALAAAKLGIALAHVGAGVRAAGRATPLDRNGILIDRLCDTLLAPDHGAVANLFAEGMPDTRVHVVGPTHLDGLHGLGDGLRRRHACRRVGLTPGEYVLVLLRGADQVTGARGASIADAVARLARKVPVVACPASWQPQDTPGAHAVREPGYADHLSLVADAGAVVTDSAVTRDEAAALGIVCHDAGGADAPRWIELLEPAAHAPGAPAWVPDAPTAGAAAARIIDTHYALRVAPASSLMTASD